MSAFLADRGLSLLELDLGLDFLRMGARCFIWLL
jgi:hypothetical protein